MKHFIALLGLILGVTTQANSDDDCARRLKADYVTSFPPHFEYVSNVNTGSEPWFYWRNKNTEVTGRTPSDIMSEDDKRSAELHKISAVTPSYSVPQSADAVRIQREETERRKRWEKGEFGRLGLPLPPKDNFPNHYWDAKERKWVGYGSRT